MRPLGIKYHNLRLFYYACVRRPLHCVRVFRRWSCISLAPVTSPFPPGRSRPGVGVETLIMTPGGHHQEFLQTKTLRAVNKLLVPAGCRYHRDCLGDSHQCAEYFVFLVQCANSKFLPLLFLPTLNKAPIVVNVINLQTLSFLP